LRFASYLVCDAAGEFCISELQFFSHLEPTVKKLGSCFCLKDFIPEAQGFESFLFV
jgi:hypothetical protein